MISVSNVSVLFGGFTLFEDISFVISARERVALVGKNGAGKSTLLKIISGSEQPTSGGVHLSKGLKIGYLPQVMKHEDGYTILEECTKVFDHITELQKTVDLLAEEMAERTDYDSPDYLELIELYSRRSDELSMVGAGNYQSLIERTLLGLGFEKQAVAQAKKNKTDRQTRAQSDSAIDKYALLVEENSSPKPNKLRYGSKVRGRIQEQDVRVEGRPMFVLSYFDALPSEEQPTARTNYSAQLERLNQRLTVGRRLVLLSGERPLETKEIEWLQSLVDREQGASSRTDYFVQRGVAHALLQDYDQAIADYAEAIGADGGNALAYFARAVALARRQEIQADRLRGNGGYSLEDLGRSRSDALTDGYLSASKTLLLPSVESEVLADLNKTIELEPLFAYAYYNRAGLFRAERGRPCPLAGL